MRFVAAQAWQSRQGVRGLAVALHVNLDKTVERRKETSAAQAASLNHCKLAHLTMRTGRSDSPRTLVSNLEIWQAIDELQPFPRKFMPTLFETSAGLYELASRQDPSRNRRSRYSSRDMPS